MHVLLKRMAAGLFVFGITASHAFGMGQPASIFEVTKAAGIWDHTSEFYLRLDLTEFADVENKNFLWAGFYERSPNEFKGEIVSDQFGKGERRFEARAKLVDTTATASYYRVEVYGADGFSVIKEMFVKGPVREMSAPLPTK